MSCDDATRGEVWKPVPGWEGLYEVSDRGRVRSLPRTVVNVYGPYLRPGRILRPAVCNGYLRVSLVARRRQRPCYVHRLVAAAFLGPPPPGHQCNHKDSDRTNPALPNLEYVTHAGNAAHAALNDRIAYGEHHPHAKLSEAAVRQMRQLREAGGTYQAIADRYGVSIGAAWNAVKGRHWRRVQ